MSTPTQQSRFARAILKIGTCCQAARFAHDSYPEEPALLRSLCTIFAGVYLGRLHPRCVSTAPKCRVPRVRKGSFEFPHVVNAEAPFDFCAGQNLQLARCKIKVRNPKKVTGDDSSWALEGHDACWTDCHSPSGRHKPSSD